MSTATKKTSHIRVQIQTFTEESERIPKFLELFDRSLKVVRTMWAQAKAVSLDNLEAGTYTLRLTLTSGVLKDETFDLAEGEIKTIMFDIAPNSPHESHEWAYFNKNFTVQSLRDTDLKTIDYYKEPGKLVNGKLWKFKNGNWQTELLPQFTNQTIYGDGNVFSFHTDELISVLEISGDDIPNLYTSLPPGNQVNCLVKLAEINDGEVHPIDVTVSTDHLRAETLLTLLTAGAMREAKTLSNAKEAEDLLHDKMINPVRAAIGGYFLLKIGELNRLHDWANNLANWFDWLPDGWIIHATQLLNNKKKTDEDLKTIRKRLLGAASSIPVYSEGLRLLEKGLSQLWYHSKQEDNEIKKALKRVGYYLEASDCSQETTTFIGVSPSEPGRERSKALPFEIIKDNLGQLGGLVNA